MARKFFNLQILLSLLHLFPLTSSPVLRASTSTTRAGRSSRTIFFRERGIKGDDCELFFAFAIGKPDFPDKKNALGSSSPGIWINLKARGCSCRSAGAGLEIIGGASGQLRGADVGANAAVGDIFFFFSLSRSVFFVCFRSVFFFFSLLGKRLRKKKGNPHFLSLRLSKKKNMSCQSCGGKPSTFCFIEGVAYCEACNAR